MRHPLIAGNWKMNFGPEETTQFLQSLTARPFPSGVDVGVAPPYLSLPAAYDFMRTHSKVSLGIFAQNVSFAASGAFTGEISIPMLREVGCAGAIIGHSERRQLFGETDASVQKRTQFALEHNFKVILCIGETLEEREAGRTRAVVETQLKAALAQTTPTQTHLLALAYEPVWAIGTGRTATPEQAEEVHLWIREFLWNRFSRDVASRVRILYGGSVKPDVTEALISKPNIDGFLIGGASLKVHDFLSIIQISQSTPKQTSP